MAMTRALKSMTAPLWCALANRKASATAFPRNCVKRKKLQAASAGAAVSKRWNPSTANYCRTAVQPTAAMDRQAARRRCCANGLKNDEARTSGMWGQRVAEPYDLGG